MNNIIEDFNLAVEKLKEGKVGIFPTDTAFGIGSRIDNVKSIERIYRTRNRPQDKALLALVSSVEMAKEYVEINETAQSIIDKYWPGALTIILNCKKEKIPAIVRADGETLAVRMPENSVLREIIQNVGVPIVAPSANKSGEKTPFTLEEIDQELLKEVDFVLKGVCKMKGVSTIIDVTRKPIEVVRQGVVKFED